MLAALAPRSAHAAVPAPALEIDLRAGYALPGGNLSGDSGATKGLELGNTVSGMVPLAADIGLRIAGHWYVGGYFSYGFALLPKDSCASGVSCSAHDIRFGLDVGYHVLPNNKDVDPWFAIGAGYEILGGSESADQQSVDFSFGGFEYGHLEAGVDLPRAQLGPFVRASVGEYGSASLAGTSVPDFPTATHSWFELGLRGYFDVWLGPHYDVDPLDDDHGDAHRWTPAPPAPSPPLADVPAPPAPPPPPATASLAAPVIFPPGVHMADRSQCSLHCSAEEQPLPPAAAARIESPMRKHLAALRGCSLDAGRTKESPPITVVFDASGVGRAQLHLDPRSESMRACVSRFPASPTLLRTAGRDLAMRGRMQLKPLVFTATVLAAVISGCGSADGPSLWSSGIAVSGDDTGGGATTDGTECGAFAACCTELEEHPPSDGASCDGSSIPSDETACAIGLAAFQETGSCTDIPNPDATKSTVDAGFGGGTGTDPFDAGTMGTFADYGCYSAHYYQCQILRDDDLAELHCEEAIGTPYGMTCPTENLIGCCLPSATTSEASPETCYYSGGSENYSVSTVMGFCSSSGFTFSTTP